MKTSKLYNLYSISRFISICQNEIQAYMNILDSDDIMKFYRLHNMSGKNEICEAVNRFKLCCKSVCPFYIIFGKLCMDIPAYYKLGQLADSDTSTRVQVKLLKAGIKLYTELVMELEKMKTKLEAKSDNL